MTTLFRDYSHYERLVREAEFSDCGRYRWYLRRSWKHGGDGRVVTFIGLNPSTADAKIDDPTIRRCMGFVKAWGASTLHMLNLFALRATDPKELLTSLYEPVGKKNDMHLRTCGSGIVVAAWGAWVPFARDKVVRELLKGIPLKCLGKTKSGAPRHPLYVRKDQPLEVFGV